MLHVPDLAANAITSVTDNPYIIALLIDLIILILGCIMDMAPIILIATPILLPIATSIGIDPIQFGIIVVLNCGIGRGEAPDGEGRQGHPAVLPVHVHRPAAADVHPRYQPCHPQAARRLRQPHRKPAGPGVHPLNKSFSPSSPQLYRMRNKTPGVSRGSCSLWAVMVCWQKGKRGIK